LCINAMTNIWAGRWGRFVARRSQNATQTALISIKILD
jgi:hypothetical protein